MLWESYGFTSPSFSNHCVLSKATSRWMVDHLPANFWLKVYHVYKLQQQNKCESHELHYTWRTRSHWSFRFGETICFPRKFETWLRNFFNIELFCWWLMIENNLKKMMLIHVKVAVSHHSPCWSWSCFIIHEENCYRFSFGWKFSIYKQYNTLRWVITQTSEANKNSLLRLADRNLGVARSTLCWGICWVSRLLPFAGCLHLVLFVALHFLQPVQ